MSSLIFFFLENTGNLLRIESLGDELVVFLIVGFCLFREEFDFSVLFLSVSDAQHFIEVKLYYYDR